MKNQILDNVNELLQKAIEKQVFQNVSMLKFDHRDCGATALPITAQALHVVWMVPSLV